MLGNTAEILQVPREGLEPTPPCGERILSPPRLPFRHLGKEWRRRADLNRCIGVLQTPALTTWLRRPESLWSGRRDSNSRPSPWQGDVLPAELLPPYENVLYYKMVPRRRFELLRAYAHHPLKMACLPIPPPRRLFTRETSASCHQILAGVWSSMTLHPYDDR